MSQSTTRNLYTEKSQTCANTSPKMPMLPLAIEAASADEGAPTPYNDHSTHAKQDDNGQEDETQTQVEQGSALIKKLPYQLRRQIFGFLGPATHDSPGSSNTSVLDFIRCQVLGSASTTRHQTHYKISATPHLDSINIITFNSGLSQPSRYSLNKQGLQENRDKPCRIPCKASGHWRMLQRSRRGREDFAPSTTPTTADQPLRKQKSRRIFQRRQYYHHSPEYHRSSSTTGAFNLHNLPLDVIFLILDYIGPAQQRILGSTCKALYEAWKKRYHTTSIRMHLDEFHDGYTSALREFSFIFLDGSLPKPGLLITPQRLNHGSVLTMSIRCWYSDTILGSWLWQSDLGPFATITKLRALSSDGYSLRYSYIFNAFIGLGWGPKTIWSQEFGKWLAKDNESWSSSTKLKIRNRICLLTPPLAIFGRLGLILIMGDRITNVLPIDILFLIFDNLGPAQQRMLGATSKAFYLAWERRFFTHRIHMHMDEFPHGMWNLVSTTRDYRAIFKK
ncbi:hypothetical protein BDZ45DRAFT_749322 [Acephala macrosclerotiorum]|nr:hypothetical protein BDZ45DRAFT_749322 [Acephala macrosclerotiorum]